jgi:Asp/Glu/hydantoin racemase
LGAASDTYEAELAMITCSSVTQEMIDQLRAEYSFPILKIDYPMAQQAVRIGKRIGIAATFPPTIEPTSTLLVSAAEKEEVPIELVREVVPEAYQALLANDLQKHDELLFGAIERLEAQDVAVIVLAQVSMARILPRLGDRGQIPVLTSLHTSLEAIRAALV